MDIKLKTTVKENAFSTDIFHAILESRGLKTDSTKDDFLHPKSPDIAYLLKSSGIKKTQLVKAKNLLDSHLSAGHDISIFGDYDADGVTSTAIMWQAITAYAKIVHSKSRILPFIPDRHKHGYGLGAKAVSEVISGIAFQSGAYKDFVPSLIITVDTGIVAHEGIKTFRDSGIDVIVSDHHEPEKVLPSANVIIHTLSTSGAGVAWIISLYLLGDLAIKLLDLATIGVVADMMPLVGLNRVIVSSGLKSLTTTRRPGLLAMKKAMGIENKALTTYDISFGIAPRLNAAGRIYNPLDALRLLCTSDSKQGIELARVIESHNKDRQDYTDSALSQASQMQVKHNIIVIIGDYHEGVIGLVASKLTELLHKPSVIMSNNGDVIKGSARSVPGVNITSLLRSLSTPFLGLGGHDQAAGFSITFDQVQNMIAELETIADHTISTDLLVKHYAADLYLPLKSATLDLAKMLHALEPFGMANQKPKFLFKDLDVVEDRRLGDSGKHRKLSIIQDGNTRELMLFNTKEPYPLTHLKQVIATLDINNWRDKESLQLIGSYVEI